MSKMSSSVTTPDVPTDVVSADVVPAGAHGHPKTSAPRRSQKNEGLIIAIHLLQTLRTVDPEFPIQYALCLSEIARREHLSITELAQRTHISLSTVSRIISALSNRKGRYGQLIDVKPSPQESRRKELSLTPKGHVFIGNMTNISPSISPN